MQTSLLSLRQRDATRAKIGFISTSITRPIGSQCAIRCFRFRFRLGRAYPIFEASAVSQRFPSFESCTRMLTGPSSASLRATIRATASASATSAWTAMTRPGRAREAAEPDDRR
jgi:hypothetical protein